MKKLLIAAGGTGGHIYPGIAVANELLGRGEWTVKFVGTQRGLETKIVPQNGFELELIDSSGLKNVGFAGKIKGLAVLPKSFFEARRLLKSFDPDVVVGAGGYVSGPVLLAARLLGIPTLVMDSNALPGFTNRQLARFVDRAALTFDEALPYFGSKGVVTGNPVRKEFFTIGPKPPGDGVHILIFGGSQGARAINNAMADSLELLKGLAGRLTITHQTGEADLGRISEAYRSSEFADADVRPFISDMFVEFAKADLVICRAGATTCAELAAAGRPAIMVPLPTAADDHQRKNAEALRTAGAAEMILQAELTPQLLAAKLHELIDTPGRLAAMAVSAKKLGRSDAARAAAEIIEELAEKQK